MTSSLSTLKMTRAPTSNHLWGFDRQHGRPPPDRVRTKKSSWSPPCVSHAIEAVNSPPLFVPWPPPPSHNVYPANEAKNTTAVLLACSRPSCTRRAPPLSPLGPPTQSIRTPGDSATDTGPHSPVHQSNSRQNPTLVFQQIESPRHQPSRTPKKNVGIAATTCRQPLSDCHPSYQSCPSPLPKALPAPSLPQARLQARPWYSATVTQCGRHQRAPPACSAFPSSRLSLPDP